MTGPRHAGWPRGQALRWSRRQAPRLAAKDGRAGRHPGGGGRDDASGAGRNLPAADGRVRAAPRAGLPAVRVARHPGAAPGVRSAVRLSRPLLAPLLPPVRSAARRSGLLLASPWLTSPWLTSPWLTSLWPTARTAVSAARRTPAGRAVEPVLWRTLRARPAVRPQPPGRGRLAEPPAEAAVGRVGQVASALVMAGTISEATARTVLDSLTDALSLRGKLAARPAVPAAWPPVVGAGFSLAAGVPSTPAAGGPRAGGPDRVDAASGARRVPGRGSPARAGPGPGPGGAYRGRAAALARFPAPWGGALAAAPALRSPHRRR